MDEAQKIAELDRRLTAIEELLKPSIPMVQTYYGKRVDTMTEAERYVMHTELMKGGR